ncbi:MAG: molybdopterin molybdotransferase MoeA [Burkholderiales bacterium]|nr:molybdopterin molybdotransferase MoeA [Burkholderiales bacterium]
MLSINELLTHVWGSVKAIEQTESLPLESSHGRVLSVPVVAPFSQPVDPLSSMDGYALRLADLIAPDGGLNPDHCVSGQVGLPVSQRVPAGSNPEALKPGTAARIFTGAVLPQGADTVVMQEDVTVLDTGHICVSRLPSIGQWVRGVGDDIAQGRPMLEAGTRFAAGQLGLLASMGVTRLTVFRKLRVGILFTGDELRQLGEPLGRGQIYNSNRWMWRSLLQLPFIELHDLGRVQDNLAATQKALRSLSHCDLILSSGGVSVGEEDHIRAAVMAEGELTAWKVAMKPGKPIAVGHVRRPDGSVAQFMGLPGNPVSSYASFLLFVRPYLLGLAGVAASRVGDWRRRFYYRPAAFVWSAPDAKRVEFLRARLNNAGEVEIHANQSSAALSSVAWAEGFVKIEPQCAVAKGMLVSYLPFTELLS